MSKQSKKEQSAHLINNFGSMICPICKLPQFIKGLRLVCKNNHSFDIARQGYVNVLNQTVKTNYTQELFTARRKLISTSLFFKPLHQALVELSLKHFHTPTLNILDAGCGEGSHLAEISEQLTTSWGDSKITVGVDISKEGVLEAAKHYRKHLWFVADIANLPFKANTFDIIFNILSPANYQEFTRVLKSNGRVIKVVPQKDYLKELREFNGETIAPSDYSNEKIVDLFYDHFTYVEKQRLHYQVELEEVELESLLRMTPLTWSWGDMKVKEFKESVPPKIIADFDILLGKSD